MSFWVGRIERDFVHGPVGYCTLASKKEQRPLLVFFSSSFSSSVGSIAILAQIEDWMQHEANGTYTYYQPMEINIIAYTADGLGSVINLPFCSLSLGLLRWACRSGRLLG
jgi:hypothetical protein